MSRVHLRTPLLVLAGAFVIRLAHLLCLRSSPLSEIYFSDQLYYRDWALRIAGGDWLGHGVFEQGPLYAYLLGTAYHFLGPRDVLVLGMQLSLGLVTVLLVYLSAGRLFSHRAAVVSGLLAAVYGPLVFYEAEVMKTFLEPLLTMVALWSALRHADRGKLGWLAISGLAVGLLCLVREVHALLLLPLSIWGWFEARHRGSAPWLRLRPLAALVFAFSLPLACAAARNYAVAGEFVAATSGGGEVAYIGFGPSATGFLQAPHFVRPLPHLEHEDFRDEARLRTGRNLSRTQASHFWYAETVREILKSPARALRLIALRAALLLNDYEIPDSESFNVARNLVPSLRILPTFGWVAGLGLLGIVASMRSNRAALALGFLAAMVAGVLLTYISGRFRLAIVPLWLLFAGRAVDWIASAIALHEGHKRLRLAGAAVAVAGSVALSVHAPPGINREERGRTHEAFRQEILTLAQHRAAIPGLRRALRADPQSAVLQDSLGFELENTGKVEEAARLYETALKFNPDLDALHWRLADIRFRQGLLEEAVEHVREFVRLRPDASEGHLALAVFISRLALSLKSPPTNNLQGEAEDHFQEALRLDPHTYLVHFYVGKMSALTGDLNRAIKEVSTAVELNPGFPEASRLLGLLLEKGGGRAQEHRQQQQ